ncbi:MAG: hypothetical protein OXU36_12335 [Candidatus Poribacteria bacterium]|nr:hypothetical protein [Candidatus Poribacteria bacterium]
MNPSMAPTAHRSQIAESLSADTFISLVMHLCRTSPAFPTSAARPLHNRPAFIFPSC